MSICGQDISPVHLIYIYIYIYYSKVKILELLDLKGHKAFFKCSQWPGQTSANAQICPSLGPLWHICNVNSNLSQWYVLNKQAFPLILEWYSHICWPRCDTIWCQRSGSTLLEVMANCLAAPTHYLSKCWCIIKKIHRNTPMSSLDRPSIMLLLRSYKKNFSELSSLKLLIFQNNILFTSLQIIGHILWLWSQQGA